MTRRLVAMILFVVTTAAFAGGVWRFALHEAVARLADRGRSDLSLASDRLSGQLQRYRQMVVLLADHPLVRNQLAEPTTEADTVEVLLLETADKTGSLDIGLLDPQGRVLASSRPDESQSYPATPDFRRALHGALGFFHSVDPRSGQRLFSYAAPVFSETGPVIGVIVVHIDAATVETVWRGQPQTIFFTDRQGVVFISNRDELLLTRNDRPSEGPDLRDLIYPAGIIRTGPRPETWRIGDNEAWQLDAGPYIPRHALHLATPMPAVGMTAEALLDLAPARRQAALQTTVAATLCLGFGAMLFAVSERRRALSVRLASEARANSQLEQRVQERTRELSQTNERLQRAQSDLVQAGKLSALGQVSAGISHELNQPLMAIRSYAENAALFLDRNQTEQASQNLGRISELARRMGRIIKNLRAFARHESEAVVDVDLVAVIEAALELSEMKLRGAGVAVDWQPPAEPVLVRGGEVRLQQVVVNLVSNAADAMSESRERRIILSITREGGRVQLRVADTGPGIAEPERIFDPFYSTKAVGHSEGMGLGLSISYGLVQSFGGAIIGRNRPDGGAEFMVELAASDRAEAA